jgi:transposase
MGRKGSETTEEERIIIINVHNQCKTLGEISRIANRPRSTIEGITDRYGTRNTVKNNRRSGRPRKIKEYDGRAIIRKVKQNPRVSAAKIAANLKTTLT